MKIPKLLVGRPGYCDYKLAVLAAPFQLGGSILQADAAVRQAEMQMDANREQIQAQKEENDKAFRRNSSLGQKAQLMAAGLSEQQAMQVIAGNGAVGTAEPAEIRSEMEGVDLTGAAAAYGQGLSGLGQAVASTASEVASSFLSPDGGSLGAFVATPFLDEFSSVLSYIDRSKVHSFIDLENWGKSLPFDTEQGKAIHALLDSKAFSRVKHFAPGIKSVNRFIGEVYTANLDSNQAFEQRMYDIKVKISTAALQDVQKQLANADIELRESQKNLTDEQKLKVMQDIKVAKQQEKLLVQQTLGAKWDALLKQFEYERFDDNKGLWSNYDKQMLLAQTEEFINKYAAFHDEETKKLFIRDMKASFQGNIYLNLLHAMQDKSLLSRLENDPGFNWIVTAYSELNRVGLNPKAFSIDIGGLIGSINTGVNRDYSTAESHDNPVTVEHF